ncbi:MAG: DinB family protein [Bacteroidota bacterium]
MNETAKEYISRLLGYLGDKDSVKIMSSTPKKLKNLIKTASKKELQKRPKPDKWSAAEIIAHLAEVEIVLAYRMRMILSVSGTPIQAMDQDLWMKNAGYIIADPKAALEMFTVQRENNLALLDSLSKEQWSQYGMHAERGKESITHIVNLYGGHDLNHLMQIEAILKGK